MSTGKELKFQFVLDTQSFQQVKRALGELTTEAQKFAKAMQSSGGGGSLFGGASLGNRKSGGSASFGSGLTVGTSSLAQAVLKDIDAIRTLSRTGAESMKMMKDMTGQSIRDQIASIERLDQKIKLLKDRYDSLKTPAQKANSALALTALTAQRDEKHGTLSPLHDLNAQLQFGEQYGPVRPPPAPTYGGIFKSMAMSRIGSALGVGEEGMAAMGGGAMGGAMGTVAIAGAVGAAVAAVTAAIAAAGVKAVNTSVAFDEKGASQVARHGQAFSPFIDQYKTRDASILTKTRGLKGVLGDDGAVEALRGVFGDDQKTKQWISGLSSTISSADFTFSDLSKISRDSKGAEALGILMDRVGQSAPHRLGVGRAMEYFDSTRGDRLAMSQILGRGLSTDPKTGLTSDPYTDDLYGTDLKVEVGRQGDEFVTLPKKGLHQDGFTQQQRLSAYLASAHGMGSGAFTGDIMSSQAAGWGGYGGILTAAARMAGTGGARGLATLGLGGGISRGAGMQLAQGVLGTGFDPRGTTGMAGVLSAFQGGYGSMLGKDADPALQFNAVNQYLAGLQTGSATTMGTSSPFQLGMNVLGAVGAMPGSSMYHQDMLAQRFDMKQMMAGASGTLTGTMADVARLTGMDKSTFQKQIDSSFGGSLAQWADTGANDGVSLAMRKFRKSGKGLRDFAKTASKDDLTALGIAQAEITGGDLEGSIGSMFALKGLGHKGVGGAAPAAGKPDVYDASKREAEAKAARESADELKKNLPELVKDQRDILQVNQAQLTTLEGLLILAAGSAGVDVKRLMGVGVSNAVTRAATGGAVSVSPLHNIAQTITERLGTVTPGSTPPPGGKPP